MPNLEKTTAETEIAADDCSAVSYLVCRAGPHLCALPLANVIETMRPLPVEPFALAPRFIRGLSVIRGAPVPVVDARSLFGDDIGNPQRLVTVNAGDRVVALGFDTVLGIRAIAAASFDDLPPLMQGSAGDVVSAIGTLDAEFLLFLRAARLLPEDSVEGSELDRSSS